MPNKTLDFITNIILASELNIELKKQAIEEINLQKNLIISGLNKLNYAAPEIREPRIINSTNMIMAVIEPYLKKEKTGETIGRDIYRQIYSTLGGKAKVTYETSQISTNENS